MTASSSTGSPLPGKGLERFVSGRLRKHMRWIYWGFVAAIVGLALVMKAPVWFVWPALTRGWINGLGSCQLDRPMREAFQQLVAGGHRG